MLGSSTEKRVMREADRIVSMKDDMDALSWGRVMEIGKLLQVQTTVDVQQGYARELVTIARANLSLASRLGIDSSSSSGQVMASGMKIIEGGLAEAAVSEQSTDEEEPTMSTEELFDEDRPAGASGVPYIDSSTQAGQVAEGVPEREICANRRLGRFCNLYESRDGSLCVFEDEHGHLVAVNASKLA